MSVQNKLSDKSIKNLKPKAKKFKVGDGDKLWLIVFPTGAKSWLYVWRQNGTIKDMTIGPYPAISLKQAREERDRLNSITALGKDPREERMKEAAAAQQEEQDRQLTFRKVALDWYDSKTTVNSEKTR